MKYVTLIYMPTVTEEGLVAAGDFLHDRTEATHTCKRRVSAALSDREMVSTASCWRHRLPSGRRGPMVRRPGALRSSGDDSWQLLVLSLVARAPNGECQIERARLGIRYARPHLAFPAAR